MTASLRSGIEVGKHEGADNIPRITNFPKGFTFLFYLCIPAMCFGYLEFNGGSNLSI